MRAGKLRQQIIIQQATETRTSTGAIITTWSTLATVRASKEDLKGREYFQAQQIQTLANARFVIRYLETVRAKMRILCPTDTVYAASTISAVASDDSFNDSASGLGGFAVGNWILVAGFDAAANLGAFQITIATAAKLTTNGSLADEGAGDAVTITKMDVYDILSPPIDPEQPSRRRWLNLMCALRTEGA